jgi:hypothetical protein
LFYREDGSKGGVLPGRILWEKFLVRRICFLEEEFPPLLPSSL